MQESAWFFPAIASLAIWGVSIFLPKLAVHRLPALHLIVYQMGFFFLTAVALQAFYGFDIDFSRLGLALFAVMIGIVGGVGQLFYIFAIQKGPFSLVAMITALYPAIVILLGTVFLQEVISLRQYVGIGLGLAAIVLITMRNNHAQGENAPTLGSWLVPACLALIFWGLWGFLPKIALESLSPHSVIFFESIGNLTVGAIIAIFCGFRLEVHARSISILALSSALSVAAILTYFYALKTGPVSIISPMTALYPVISVILSRIFLKEKISLPQAAAMAMAGVTIVFLAG